MNTAIEHFGPYGQGTVVAGVEWHRTIDGGPYIAAHTDDYEYGPRLLTIERTGAVFEWEWCVRICAGVYARVRGRAGSIAQAAAAAVGVTPHWHRNPETGHNWLCYPSGAHVNYITHFNGEEANVYPDCKPSLGASWSRVHHAAAQLMDMLHADESGHRRLRGYAENDNAAMTAAERAPQALHAACRALLAAATPNTPQPHPTNTEA